MGRFELRCAVFLVVVALCAAIPATAKAGCDPGRTPNYVAGGIGRGWLLDVASGEEWSSLEANMDVHDPYVNADSSVCNFCNASYAWIMMTRSQAGSHWAQFGPFTANNGDRYNFMQCYDGTTFDNIPDTPSSVGADPLYEIVNNGTTNKEFYLNGTFEAACPYTFSSTQAQALSETKDVNDQVPGNVSNHESWSNAQAVGSGGTTHDLFENLSDEAVIGSPGSYFGLSRVGDQEMGTWDTACS